MAMTSSIHQSAVGHLNRADGQEDLCFALWYPSQGKKRLTALIDRIVLPDNNDRDVHGNVSFNHKYFQRVLLEARRAGAGLTFMHSHLGPGWQGMSYDDIKAEEQISPAVLAATGLPLVGMTVGTDGAWSARFWKKIKPKKYVRRWCGNVRIVGKALDVTFMDELVPRPKFKRELTRTISAWGEEAQNDLARLRIGIVGLGSVGSIVAESLARMGIQRIKLIDFDKVKFLNLDRTLHATQKDAKRKRFKVDVIKSGLKKSATSDYFEVEAIKGNLAENEIFKEALDCDVLFSCVDRPLARSILNNIAYAHLIPVIDGGIRVEKNKFGKLSKADWKVHIASPGRRCLECLGQYNPSFVQMEREGRLEEPSYIQGLPEDHELRRNENVFTFSLNLASMEVLQMLMMVISPLGISDMGEQMFHFVPGILKKDKEKKCSENCIYQTLIAKGDRCGIKVAE